MPLKPELRNELVRLVEELRTTIGQVKRTFALLSQQFPEPVREFIPEIQSEFRSRGISCLVHFTRLTSLQGIMRRGRIESSQRLRARKCLKVINDFQRRDGHHNYVCCSVQYPNVYLLEKYRLTTRDLNWVYLCLNPDLLALTTTRFAPVNAATHNGKLINDGIDGFKAMFERRVPTNPYKRKSNHLLNGTTDLQAEVLVKGFVPICDIDEVLVENEEISAKVKQVMHEWSAKEPKIRVQPILFDKTELSSLVRGTNR